jgi:carboxypeptidase Q
VRSAGGSQNRLAHTGALRYADGVTKIPAAAATYEDAEIIAYLVKMGRVRTKLVLTPQTLLDAVSCNVIADLKGSEKPDENVLAFGHLDSWDLGQGAIDDAAGVAVSMQVTYILKQLNLQPKRTIRFVAWMNEENGTAGGRTYAREEDPTKHFAVIESNLGASHALGFNFAGKPEAMRMFAPVSQILSEQGAPLVQMQSVSTASAIKEDELSKETHHFISKLSPLRSKTVFSLACQLQAPT